MRNPPTAIATTTAPTTMPMIPPEEDDSGALGAVVGAGVVSTDEKPLIVAPGTAAATARAIVVLLLSFAAFESDFFTTIVTVALMLVGAATATLAAPGAEMAAMADACAEGGLALTKAYCCTNAVFIAAVSLIAAVMSFVVDTVDVSPTVARRRPRCSTRRLVLHAFHESSGIVTPIAPAVLFMYAKNSARQFELPVPVGHAPFDCG